MFDSSVERGQPAKFPLGSVIKGWTEGLQLMVVGEKRRFWIPGNLAYGDTAGGGRPSGMLVFDVELLGITSAAQGRPRTSRPRPRTPRRRSPASPTACSRRAPARSTRRRRATVEVHYSGWTTDGKMFDSSVARGMPATFPLNGVIKGWTEGVQLMVVGEKTRFWIPGELAYDSSPRPGAPKGMLVFDIELLSIK